MKKLITKFAKWWLRKNSPSPSISLESKINYLGHEFKIQNIMMSVMSGQTELTINATEREDEK